MSEAEPLVSIVTPTFPGREEQLMRCMQRVFELDWPNVQHVIVSDRTDEADELIAMWNDLDAARRGPEVRDLTFVQINETWRNAETERSIGAYPWMIGSRLAMGEFVGFCGDDDELKPDHVRLHVDAMRQAEAMWSVSQVEFYVHGQPSGLIVGDDTYEHGHVDATGIMCWQGALQSATWKADGEIAADWRIVRDWRLAGLVGTMIPKVTGRHNDGWMIGASGRPDRPK